MNREEAIKIIDCYDIGFYDLSGEKIPANKLAEAFDMAIEALQDRLTGEWIKHEIETFKAHLKDAEERTTEVYEYDDFQYAYFLGKAKAYDEVIRRLGGDTE